MIRFSQVARTMRTMDILNEQCRALRKRVLIDNYINKVMKGAYWGSALTLRIMNCRKTGIPRPWYWIIRQRNPFLTSERA